MLLVPEVMLSALLVPGAAPQHGMCWDGAEGSLGTGGFL